MSKVCLMCRHDIEKIIMYCVNYDFATGEFTINNAKLADMAREIEVQTTRTKFQRTWAKLLLKKDGNYITYDVLIEMPHIELQFLEGEEKNLIFKKYLNVSELIVLMKDSFLNWDTHGKEICEKRYLANGFSPDTLV